MCREYRKELIFYPIGTGKDIFMCEIKEIIGILTSQKKMYFIAAMNLWGSARRI